MRQQKSEKVWQTVTSKWSKIKSWNLQILKNCFSALIWHLACLSTMHSSWVISSKTAGSQFFPRATAPRSPPWAWCRPLAAMAINISYLNVKISSFTIFWVTRSRSARSAPSTPWARGPTPPMWARSRSGLSLKPFRDWNLFSRPFCDDVKAKFPI